MEHFNTYLKEKDFLPVFKFLTDQNKTENMHSEKYRSIAKPYYKAFHNFLMDYKKEHGLEHVVNGQSHTTNLNAFWNRYIDGKETNLQDAYRGLDNLFSKALIFTVFDSERLAEQNQEDPFKVAYKNLTESFNKGDFRSYLLPDSEYCFCCGEYYQIEVNNWQPKFIKVEYTTVNGKMTSQKSDPPNCFDKSVQTLEVEFKTGHLLVSDWFRIEEFTQITAEDFDVNCTKGRVQQVKYLLDNFNVLSIPSTGSAHIFRNGNSLAFGNYDEEAGYPEGSENLSDEEFDALEIDDDVKDSQGKVYESLDRVNSGLRNVTIIEKDQLISIVAKHEEIQGDLEKAKSIVEEYLDENDYEINLIEVPPGKYTVTYSGNWYDFKNDTTHNESFSSNFEPYFTLRHNDELIKINKPKMK